MPEPHRRPCRDHEREWQGRYVDRELSDEWLVALNGLASFQLISICAGHAGESSDRPATPPHINLRLRPELTRLAYATWDGLSVGLAAEFSRLFPREHTIAEAEISYRVIHDRGGASLNRRFIIRVRGLSRRRPDEPDPEMKDWFGSTVVGCRQLDRFVTDRLGVSVAE